MVTMEYNECSYCGAKDGRAGILFSSPSMCIEKACQNCWDTLKTGSVVIHANLKRTEEEVRKTMTLITGINEKVQ